MPENEPNISIFHYAMSNDADKDNRDSHDRDK